jgi:glycosyltransferase involved in cell wall biosynthesis
VVTGSGRTAFCTVVAKNYLAYARVLVRSLRRHHPGVDVFVILADETAGHFDPAREDFAVIGLDELDLPSPRELCFRYDVVELSTAVRPFLLRHLFAQGYARLIYLDPDVRVYAPLSEVLALLDRHPVLLTPHRTRLGGPEAIASERRLLLSGAYNMGFLGLSREASVDRLLQWWSDRCVEHCLMDPSNGLFVDQRWMDLAPGMVEGVHILRDPGYNVAYWNLGQRALSGEAAAPIVDGRPLVLFHFSGFDPAIPSRLSRHDESATHREPLPSMLRSYAGELEAAGHRDCSRWSYTWGAFADGHPISREMRAVFREQPRGRFLDPFRVAGPDSFRAWTVSSPPGGGLAPLAARLADTVAPSDMSWRARAGRWIGRVLGALTDADGSACLAPLARRVLQDRPDVQRTFVRHGRLDRLGFLRWLAHDGLRTHQLRPEWCAEWLAEDDRPRLVSRLTAFYDSRPELRSRFPQAFVEEHDAPAFVEWLAAHAADAGFTAEDVAAVRRLLEERPVRRIREILRRRPDLARAFPEALTSPADPPFLSWLEHSGRGEYELRPDTIAWFARAQAQHMCADRLCPVDAADVGEGGSADLGVTVAGDLRAEIGRGELGRATLRSIEAAGLRFATVNVEDDRIPDSSLPFSIVHLGPDTALRLAAPPGRVRGAGYRIGYWAWELEAFPPSWIDAFALFDEIWTYSRHAAACIATASPVPVQTLWPSLAEPVPSPAGRTELGLPPDQFLFLATHDLESPLERKNTLGLLGAFREAFRRDDAVHLVLEISGPDCPDRARVEDAARGLPATILDRGDMGALHQACDAYVSLHRAEGFGFAMADAMRAGRPVIATYYSGNVDFMSPWNSFPVPYTLTEIEKGAGLWAEPDPAAAAALMRAVFERRDMAAEVALRGQEDVRRLLSPEACGRRIVDRLRVVHRARK